MQTEWTSEQLASKVWDAVIVGGGMVGATVALGLARNGFQVLLLEKVAPALSWQPDTPYQTRVSALTRASENILRSLGVWPAIEKRRLHAFTDMHVWEDISNAEIHFDSASLEEPNLGYIIENNVIQAALWEMLLNDERVTPVTGRLLSEVTLNSNFAQLTFEEGLQLETKLVIGADGAFSKLRQLANIGVDTHDYQQCAIVGCVKTEFPHQNTCWQRYRHEGPFAYLPMDDNVSSIAWYLPLEKMQWALELDDIQFAREVEKASGSKLGRVIEGMERVGFPLVRRHAQHYVKPHLALVGDAAHTIHPQAGQGVNLGLLDAAALIETLSDAKQASNQDWSRMSVLRRYERWRRGDNAIVQKSMEGFDWLFKQDVELKNQIRKTLLPIADHLTPAKNWLMEQALNGRDQLPVLAK
ncbi:MAG: UbiH/UbiF/VisC/COQ6 family ubiquinone biosynthesis hydroxylase [Hydrogenovibrio sp.]|nr:UbiH/UbiF/VisC/COQ6 family ubiquinone biosynthesis hydroxylase [Hydrogenovibrio sp.]